MTQETYKLSVGSIECIILADAYERIPDYLSMFPHLDPNELKRAAEPHLDASGVLIGSLNILLIKTGGRTYLVDAGMGAATKPASGHLLDNLQSVGIAPEAIDTVIISHAHGDHINGTMDAGGDFVFPHANYVMWAEEWNYWTSEETLASMEPERAALIRKKLAPFQEKLTLIESEDQEIAPGVCPMSTPGHTPGHMSLMIESDGERLVHMVDVSHLLFQPKHPEWSSKFDSQPELAADTRRRFYEQAVAENWLVLAYHHPFPGLGHFEKGSDGFAWKPIQD